MPNIPPSPRTIARYCTLAGKYSARSFRLGSGNRIRADRPNNNQGLETGRFSVGGGLADHLSYARLRRPNADQGAE
jgi:hypothetical protein